MEKEKAKHNCLVLIICNINHVKQIREVEEAIKGLLGSNNVASIFFPNREDLLHSGTPNVEVTTLATYKQFVTKNIKMFNHYVKFTLHPRSLDGLAAPNQAHLKDFKFTDINTTLANTVESLRNAPSSSSDTHVTKAKITNMVREALKEENKTLKFEIFTDMQEIKNNIIEEANAYIRNITKELKGKLDQELKMLMMQLQTQETYYNHLNSHFQIRASQTSFFQQ